MNDDESFEEYFQECCRCACTILAEKHKHTDPEYLKLSQECNTLYHRLEEKLGAEHNLVNQFDAAKNAQLFYDDIFIYQQGFQDCIYLLRWMELI